MEKKRNGRKRRFTGEDLIREAKKYIGTPFGHQGRTRERIDCGGLILVVGNELELTELQELGYASFPTNGRFERLLAENAEDLGFESRYPHKFDGTEFRVGDILSFDYNNGEGVRHIAFVTQWDGRRYWVIDAQPVYGVAEHPLAHPYSKATIHGWRPRGLKK